MNTKALEKVSVIPQDEPNVPAIVQQTTAMTMLDRAVASGASMEVIEKLMGLQERWEANQARKAFDEAVSAAKAAIPPITRNATGHNSKKYADFAAIAKVVDPILGSYGLSYRFRTTQTDKISVTCILSHKAGHNEETTLSAPPDPSGGKSAIHAIGSTLTYLQRYSLVQMLGLAASNDDDGNAAASTPKITEAQAGQIIDLIEAKGADRKAFLKWAKQECVEDIPADHFESCIAAINAYQPPKAK